MGPRLRKLALTAHVLASVGWLGAVATFLVLAVVGLATADEALARGLYLAMYVTAWLVILPLSLASLATGVLQALGTPWGLFRHYWVVIKLAINLLSTLVLLLYMQSLGMLRDAVRKPGFDTGDEIGLRAQAIVHSSAAVLLLVGAVVLSIHKPKGQTSYGWKRR